MDLIETDPARRVKLKISHERLAKLHPADIADIVEDLAPDEREAVFETLDEGVAAGALEELEPKVQKSVVESLETDRAADIVEEMEPDAAADLLADLTEERTAEILVADAARGAAGSHRPSRIRGEHGCGPHDDRVHCALRKLDDKRRGRSAARL